MQKPRFNKREVLVFRQFQRKGYSLFACLGREVVISVLSVATLTAAKADSISDETWRVDSTETPAREVMLQDVSVTGTRAPLTVSQAARMVTVLSRDDIAQAPVQSVNDLLKMAVGVDVRQRGALGAQTDISIRGGTQEQIIVLLNGINICDPQTGHNVMDLPCDLSDIVRIEVLEGPAGRVYGTSSLVGAINIVTRQYEDQETASRNWRGDIRLEGGFFGYMSAAARLSPPSSCLLPPSSCLLSHLSMGYARSDGFSRSRDGHLNTGYSGSKAFYQGAYRDSIVNMSWHLGITDKGWGSGTFYATPRWQADEQYEHTTKLFSALQGENRKGAVRIQSAVYWNQNRDRYEGYCGRPDIMQYNYNKCDIYGLKLNGYFDWEFLFSPRSSHLAPRTSHLVPRTSHLALRTAFGAELRNENLVSGNLGEPLYQPIHISGTDRDFTLGINRTIFSAFLEQNVAIRRLTLSAGFVATKDSWSGMNMRLYPGVDISYRLAHFTLFASYNSSLRLPSFTEMYYKLQGYAADPHLKPEKMQAVEVGAQYASAAVQAKLSAYHHHGTNMIDWIMDVGQGEEAVWQSVNHTVVNAMGLETSFTWCPQPSLRLSLSYNYTHQDKDLEPSVVSQYALEYLRHKLVARVHSALWRQLSLSLNLRWQDRVGTYTTFAGETLAYRPYALLDALLQWTARGYTVYADVSNLFNNRSYVDFGNVPQPGASIVTGVRFSLF